MHDDHEPEHDGQRRPAEDGRSAPAGPVPYWGPPPARPTNRATSQRSIASEGDTTSTGTAASEGDTASQRTPASEGDTAAQRTTASEGDTASQRTTAAVAPTPGAPLYVPSPDPAARRSWLPDPPPPDPATRLGPPPASAPIPDPGVGPIAAPAPAAGWGQPPAPRPSRPARPPRPPARLGPPWAILVAVAAAGALDVAVHHRLASVATALAVVLGALLVGAAPDRRRPAVLAPLGLAVAAGGLLVLRDSPWVVGPALLVALAGLSVAAQDRLFAVGGWLRTAAGQLQAAADAIVAVGAGLRRLDRARASSNGSVVRGLVLAALVIIPLLLLLASADAVFGELLRSTAGIGAWRHVVIIAVLAVAPLSLTVAANRSTPPDGPSRSQTGPGQTSAMTEATLVLAAVAVVLAAWGGTQIMVAVGGAERLLATAGLTAAENARQGFFQLVAATALLVAIVALVDRFTERTTAADHRRFLLLTGLVGVETLGVIAAGYSRLALYMSGFGTTMLRLAVAWFLAWLAAVLVVLVVTVNRRRSDRRSAAARFGGIVFLLAGCWVVVFGAANPEAIVAGGNLDRAGTIPLDDAYLTTELGSDAVPAIIERLDRQQPAVRERLTAALCDELADEDPGGGRLLTWNRSRAESAEALASLTCP
ncbi:MAG: DUF4153 domain-containing protein [Actinomycetota bacterium]